MAIALKNALLDGSTSWENGVDTYKVPSRVQRNQLCLSVNNSLSQEVIAPRMAWRQIPLAFYEADVNGVLTPDAAAQTAFETGLFQGFTGYVPDSGPAHLVFSVSGLLFRVDALTNGRSQQLVIPESRPTQRPFAYFCQAELFMVIQDGQSKPLIYDGASVRVSDVAGTSGTDADGLPLKEVPVGTVMAYSGGRLWVALPDGHSFVAGDGVYGPTGTATYQRRDAVLRFTENQVIAEGGAFAVPSNMGPIRAMAAMANLDTSLGQGPLQVFTPSGCFSVNAPFDRTAWQLVSYPIETVSLLDQGSVSQRATQLVNGDVWYRSLDGIRSFLIARRDFGTWGNRAMSYEVVRHLKNDDVNLLEYGSAAVFNNRLLMTCSPQPQQGQGVYHQGVVVLNFSPVTSILASNPPIWEGMWTGHDILQIASVESQGVTRCFAAVLAPEDNGGVRRIQVWELQRSPGPDVDGYGVEQRKTRALETSALDFSPTKSSEYEQKLLEGAEFWVSDVSGIVDFTLYFKPDDHPCWITWKHWQMCASTSACASDAVAGCVSVLNKKPQYRPRIGALRPPESTIGYTGAPARLGYTFQFRLEIIGEATVTAMRFLANRITEPMFGSDLPEEAECEEIISCCGPDEFPENVT